MHAEAPDSDEPIAPARRRARRSGPAVQRRWCVGLIPALVVSVAPLAAGSPMALEATAAADSNRSSDTAATAPPAPGVRGPLSLNSSTATGDWGGARPWLAERGVTTQFYYVDTMQWIVKGGLDRTGRHGATTDWLTLFDFEQMGLIPGGRGLIHVKWDWTRGVNPQTGALWQVMDDLDRDRSIYIDQLWYEQALVSERVWLKGGFLDFQTIFDRNAFANSEDKQFMNQALDNNPLIPLNIGLGAALTVKPAEWLSLTTAIGDADSVLYKPGFSTAFHGPARFVWITEPAIHVTLPGYGGGGPLKGNYRFGMIYDPRPRAEFAVTGTRAALIESHGDDVGWYASFDQQVYRENETDAQGLGWFFRYGFRHGDINQVQNFWSTGLSYTGLIPTRDRDEMGAAVFQSIPSRAYNDLVNRWAEAETGFELYYAIEVTPWMVITPDIQYISSPGIGSNVDDAIVLGVRTRISF